MIEKTLATTVEDAQAIAKSVRESGIHLVVNFETTWYSANREVHALIHDQGSIGEVRRIVFNVGHEGLVEIGVSPEFHQWLIDPQQSGGGASFNFGCYGANLITWLMQGQLPESVTAVAQQIRPDRNPMVDDQATIILSYPKAQAVIQASWNWPENRKSLEVYGNGGQALTWGDNKVRLKPSNQREKRVIGTPIPKSQNNPYSYFAAVVRGQAPIHPLTSLENALSVIKILDAVRQSIQLGKTVAVQ